MAPVARELGAHFDVHEPWQRRSDGVTPLTVATHVEDLAALLDGLDPGGGPPALVGHSWGAMLALAFGAAYPDRCGPLVLVGCGTFDLRSRAELQRRLEARMDEAVRARLAVLSQEVADPDERLAEMGRLLQPVYGHDLLDLDHAVASAAPARCDARGHRETWADVLRLQRERVHPEAFRVIRSPVLMLHGARDPHPGQHVRECLQRVLPQLEYHEWDACGHTPWLERAARDAFYQKLIGWLSAR
jgi:pimeloyl-ACP methyl ester carboxylesterase